MKKTKYFRNDVYESFASQILNAPLEQNKRLLSSKKCLVHAARWLLFVATLRHEIVGVVSSFHHTIQKN